MKSTVGKRPKNAKLPVKKAKKAEQSEQPKKTRARPKEPKPYVPKPGEIVALAVIPPKEKSIDDRKRDFIAELRSNGGVVSGALSAAGLRRTTAYAHFKHDANFAAEWADALEIANDELYTVARQRAIEGELEIRVDRSGHLTESYVKSDTLLIYLMNHGERQKKWRGRLIQTATIALQTFQREAKQAGLAIEVIQKIQDAMIKDLEAVPLS